jgi:flagellar M-ring protein FliF
MNVPYKYSEGGGALLVPADRVYDVRLRLASLGLPKGSVAGFELMESNRFGMTQFQERLTFQRGLEGELTRSIQACRPWPARACTWRCRTRTASFANSKNHRPRCC